MVNNSPQRLNAVFLALSDPTRRAILERLAQLDVQVGGSFCFDVADGSASLVGTYLEIVRPEKLVFTWSGVGTHGKETLVTVKFIEHGPLTQVVLTHERFSSKDMCSRHQAGWQALLDRLTKVLSPNLENRARFK